MEVETIIWSPLAEYSYFEIVDYIEMNFGIKYSNIFISKVISLTDRLKTNNGLCPTSEMNPNYHKCTLSEQTSLIYRILNSKIEIIDLTDNRSDHHY
jgi:plasmid stabilization system protein ParE